MEHNADFTKTRGKLFLTGKEPSALTFILQSQGKTRAVRGMPPSERRSEILRLLCKRRHETAINLATEFGVSERTIRNDLVILSCYYPIQVTWGRYGGVAHLPEWFHLENRMLSFDTLTDRQTYEVIAVFKTVVYTDSPDSFKYYQFVNADTAEDFTAYVEKCKKLSLYETGITAEYGDKLLTLSTCEYSRTNGRLVVVAKLINE